MALLAEENFKICGLCSQLVDESVIVHDPLKNFLAELLQLPAATLPSKTCMECFKSANECKRFKDACEKSISKLKRNNVNAKMILGSFDATQSNLGKKTEEAPAKAKSAAAPKSKAAAAPSPATESQKKKRILESLGLDPDKIDLDISTGRSSRSQASTASPARPSRSTAVTPKSTPSAPAAAKSSSRATTQRLSRSSVVINTPGAKGLKKASVVIKKIEKQRADRHFAKFGAVIGSGGKATGSRKRGLDTSISVDTPPPTKRLRKGYAIEVEEEDEPLKGKAVSKSSFGRVRNAPVKSGYVYDNDQDSAEVSPVTRRGSTKSTPVASRKAGPASRQKKQKPVEEVQVEDDDEEEEEEDMDEVFPTIGPYQCEICQVITDTKAEFVAHIKAEHRNVVDEDVLKSLESDIRKSAKKKGSAGAATSKPASKSSTPASAAKKKPAPASSKKSKPKPKSAPAKPQRSKKASSTPSPTKAASKSPSRSWMCENCDQVIARSTANDIERHKKSRSCLAASEKKKLEKSDMPAEDPLGGAEPVKEEMQSNNVDDSSSANDTEEGHGTVVMENAEEDIVPNDDMTPPPSAEETTNDDEEAAANHKSANNDDDQDVDSFDKLIGKSPTDSLVQQNGGSTFDDLAVNQANVIVQPNV